MTQTDFHHATPVYEEMPGWFEDIRHCRTFDELPATARAYVRRLEELSGARRVLNAAALTYVAALAVSLMQLLRLLLLFGGRRRD